MTITKEQLKAIQELSYDTGYAAGKMDGKAEGIGYRLKAQLENQINLYCDEIGRGVGRCYTDDEFSRAEGRLAELEEVVFDLKQLLKSCDEPR